LRNVRAASKFTGPDDLVFSTAKGTPQDEKNLMRRGIKPVAVKLKMPWMGWHVLRHMHATLSERIGMELVDRQAQMGHADYRMTLHYTHGDMERHRASLNTLTERLIGHSTEEKHDENAADMTLTDTNDQRPIAASA